MKNSRTSTILIALVLSVMVFFSCSSPEKKLVGTWITDDVSVSVDSTRANLASLDATIASTRNMTFTLNDDHSMTLVIDGYTTNAFWLYNENTGVVTYRLKQEFGQDEYELGTLEGDRIISSSKLKHGTLTSVHKKD